MGKENNSCKKFPTERPLSVVPSELRCPHRVKNDYREGQRHTLNVVTFPFIFASFFPSPASLLPIINNVN